jgi:hypothetical protein
MLAAATARGAQLEGITMVLLLTDEDDFNALASADLAGCDLLFLVRANGALARVTRTSTPAADDGDTLVLLGPATADS